MAPDSAESDQPTLAATRSAQGPLPSGGALELRRLREAIETSVFDRAPEVIRIGRFTVLDRIGAGGMGVVYAAYDPTLDRKVAVKVLRHEDGDGDRSRLVDEARALARLSHPCIVAVHEVGEQDGQIFLAMEYVEGKSLEHWIRREEGVQPWREVLSVFVEAGKGLAAAHDAGLVHRDFKPHNVMLSSAGAVKVLDFGLARAVVDGAASDSISDTGPHRARSGSSTVTGALAGTPAYMSPEQLASQRATARSDQFSFCVALFEALHGQRPFPGRRIEEIAISVMEGRQVRPPNFSSIPGFVRAVVARGLSTDPASRFDSMHALLDALDRGPKTRRRAVGASVALAASLMGGTAAWSLSAPDDVCKDAGAWIENAWGEAARARVREGLQASNVPRAAATWARTGPLLDTYAHSWRQQAAAGCRAHAAEQLSTPMFDRHVACLRNRGASMYSLTELLSSPDAAIVERAAALAAALPSIDGCAEATADNPSFALPQDPVAAADVSEQRNGLARARMLEAAGRFEDALTIAQRVRVSAEGLAFGPLDAEASVVMAGLAMYTEPPETTDTILGEAIALAIEADHDEATIEAVAKRAFVRAELLRDPESATDDARHADALLHREKNRDPRLGWLVHNNLGVVAERQSEPGEAILRHRTALALARGMGDRGRWDQLASLTNLAYATAGGGDSEAALALATEAVELAEATLGPDHPQLSMPLHALAQMQQATGADQAAETTLHRSIAIEAAEGAPISAASIVDLDMLAKLAQARGGLEEALEFSARAAEGANATLGPTHPITLEVQQTHAALRSVPTSVGDQD